MTDLVAINSEAHSALKIDRSQALAMHTDTHIVQVVVDEMHHLSAEFPIALVKNSDTGQFIMVAVMGFAPGENLFFENDNFNANSMPLNFARQPFCVGFNDNEELNLSVCVDMDHPAVSKQSGEALFNEQGEQTGLLQTVSSTLATLYHSDQKTKNFVDFLVENELLTSVQIKAEFEDQTSNEVNGLYTVDEERLSKLDGAILAQMMQHNYLRLAYTMVCSLSQVPLLIQRKNKKNSLKNL